VASGHANQLLTGRTQVFKQMNVKIFLPSLGCVSALVFLGFSLGATPVVAEEIFRDDFEGGAGEKVDGRGAGMAAWTASSSGAVLDGLGHVVLEGEEKVSGWISHPLPELQEGDLLLLHARVKPRSPWGGWIGIGFTRNTDSLFRDNGVLAIILRAPYAFDSNSSITFISGPGTTEDRLLSSFDGSAFRRASELDELEAIYNTGSGEWTCHLNGIEVFHGRVAFAGVGGEPVPMEFLSHICIQWAEQISATAANPALVGEIRLERKAGGVR